MKINKILIVPAELRLLKYSENLLRKSIRYFRTKLSNSRNKENIKYNAEINFYGDLPLILGKENVFVFGEYQDQYLSEMDPFCLYPSCQGTPEPTFVTKHEELISILDDIDAVLISSKSSAIGRKVTKLARHKDVPVAIIDRYDHEGLYLSENIENEICRNFIYGTDYDIYFKHTYPIRFKKEHVYPICPTPIRPKSYNFKSVKKDIDFFFIGRPRADRCQPDRAEIVNIISNNFENTHIKFDESQDNFLLPSEYHDYQSRARFVLSPSGRVWNGSRLTEAGLAKSVLIAPKPYHHTVGPQFRDGFNSILYDVELMEDGYHLTNKDDLLDKIQFYLNNLSKIEEIAENWYNDVLSGHTTLARAHNLIETLQSSL
tara:strand:- start:175 stop:1296 length:1122 start_codon:yes stop_codon:yes gene_type:complete